LSFTVKINKSQESQTYETFGLYLNEPVLPQGLQLYVAVSWSKYRKKTFSIFFHHTLFWYIDHDHKPIVEDRCLLCKKCSVQRSRRKFI